MAYYKQDQLSIKTRTKLADYFADLIILTQSLETFRIQLAQIQFFDGVQLFRYLDHQQKGFLTPKDFAKLVTEDIKKVLHYAFGWFDSSKAGQITKIQFLEFLYPRQNPQLRELVSLRMQQQLTPQQKQITLQPQLSLLRQLILQLMQRQTKLIPIRRYIMDQHDYSIKAVMNCLDVEGRGWISTNDLYKFMRNFDIDVSIESVHGLVGVCDRDYNGKISMEELDWLVEGLQRSNSAYRNIVRNTDHKVTEKRMNSCCTCKRNLTSQKKVKKNNKKEVSKTDKKENRSEWLKPNQKSSNKQTLKAKLNFDNSHTPKAKETNIKQDNQGTAKTNKSKRIFSAMSKQPKQNSYEIYNALKRAFDIAEEQTLEIDRQLRKYEQQMKIKAELEMQSKLEEARQRKKAKKEEKEKLRRKIEQLEAVRIQQKRIKDEQERILRIRQLETERLLQIQLQKNRIRQLESLRIQAEEEKIWMFQAQRSRLRQIQMMKQAQFRQMELRKEMQIREMERQRQSQIREKQFLLHIAEEQLRLKQAQQRIRNKINIQNIQQQHSQALFRDRRLRVSDTHFDYQAETRLKALHEQEFKQRSATKDKLEKQTEYYSKYNKYCNHLAQIGDPLGIKEHIAETDKYLSKSKLLRESIKKDRVYSLNRYDGSALKNSQKVTQRQKTLTESSFQRTPIVKKQRESLTNNKNESTKVKWSNN